MTSQENRSDLEIAVDEFILGLPPWLTPKRRAYIVQFFEKLVKQSRFSPDVIQGIRKDQELSQSDLAEFLGEDPSTGQVMISQYETGSRVPSVRPQGFSKKYLSWLKDQGFNPYDL